METRYQSYKFAAMVYKTNGYVANDYVLAALKTFRGNVSYDAETGDTIALMAIKHNDRKTLHAVMATFPSAILIRNNQGDSAWNHIASADEVYALMYLVISTNKPQRIDILRVCYNCAHRVYSTSESHVKSAINRAICDYARVFATIDNGKYVTHKTDIFDTVAILRLYHAMETKNTAQALSIIEIRRLSKYIHIIPDEMLEFDQTFKTYVQQHRKGRTAIPKSSVPKSGAPKHNHPHALIKSVACFVLDEDVSDANTEPLSGLSVWDCVNLNNWHELLIILRRNQTIDRNRGTKSIISCVCKRMIIQKDKPAVLNELLKRWPILTNKELTTWFRYCKFEHCELLIKIAPHQPAINDTFDIIEQILCEGISIPTQGTVESYRKKLDLITLIALIASQSAPPMTPLSGEAVAPSSDP